MLTLNQLTEGLKEAGRRYAELNRLFVIFRASLATQFSEQAIPVEEPGPGPLEHGAFDLGYAGRSLRFRFYALSRNDTALEGTISCYLVHPRDPAKDLLLHRFVFDESGKTDLPNPDKAGRGNLDISYHADALHLALHCIHISLPRLEE
jgi:hypothetical protein